MKKFKLGLLSLLAGLVLLSGVSTVAFADDSSSSNQSSAVNQSNANAVFADNKLTYDESPQEKQSLGHISETTHQKIEAVKQTYNQNHLNYGYKINPYLIWEMLNFNQKLKQYKQHPWFNIISLESTHGQSLKAVADQYLKHNYLGPTNKYGMVLLIVQDNTSNNANQIYFGYRDDGLGQHGLNYLNQTNQTTLLNNAGSDLSSNQSDFVENGAESLFQIIPEEFNEQRQLQNSASINTTSSNSNASALSDSSSNLIIKSPSKILPKPTNAQIKAGEAIYQKNDLDKETRISSELMGQIYALNQKWAKLPHHPWVVAVTVNSSNGLLAQDAAKPYLKHNPFGATNKYGMVLISANNDNQNNFGVQVNENGLGLTGLRYYSDSQAYNFLSDNAGNLKSNNDDQFNSGLATVLAFYNHRVVDKIQYAKPSWLVYQYNLHGPQVFMLIAGLLFGFLGAFFPVWVRLYHKLNKYLFPDGVNYTGDDDILFARPHQLGNHSPVHVIDDKASRRGGFAGGGGGGFSGGGGGGFGGGGASI